MAAPFDADTIATLGWRQGAVLGPALAAAARDVAPAGLGVAEGDWLIVMSHDCDVVNFQLNKEPTVEVLRAVPTARVDGQLAGGKNPRLIQVVVEQDGQPVALACRVHERWTLDRATLMLEPPALVLPDKPRRLIAEWLAKRYIRAAFPTAFDARWRKSLRAWTDLLAGHSHWIQGVYMRLSSLDELDEETPYRVDLIVAAPAARRGEPAWGVRREAIGRELEAFWTAFEPGIVCDEVEVLGTDELTLADLDGYQRFDADWVSFSDETDAIHVALDMDG